MARRSGLRLLIAAAACLLLLGACSTRQQTFSVSRPEVLLKSRVELEDEERKTRFADSDKQTLTFTQSVDIGMEGWVYHPALAVFSVDLRPKYKLQNVDSEGTAFDREDELLFLGYRFDTTMLQYKPYTLNLFSARDRNTFDTSLGEDTATETSTDRATVFLKYEPVVTTLSTERRTSKFEGFNDFEETTHSTRAESRHKSENSLSFIRAQHIEQSRHAEFSDFDVERFSGNITNIYRAGDSARFTTNLSGNMTETEDRETRVFRGSETLAVQILENLRGQIQARYSERHEDDFFSKTTAGSGSLNHRLYENLNTSLRAGANFQDSANGDRATYDSALDFRYRRRIPGGTIRLTNGYSFKYEDDNTEAVFRDIRDETLVLTGTSPVFLDNLNVDRDSIIVTDSNGLIVFIEGVDYILIESDGSIAVVRLGVGSGISDGSTVHVDYRFSADGPSEINTRAVRGGINLNLWSALTLFYNINTTKQEFVSGEHPASLTDDTVQRAGAKLGWRWSTTSVEYEDRDTVRAPLTRLSAREILLFQPSPDVVLSLNGNYTETELKDTNDETRQYGGEATARWRLYRSGELRGGVFARRVRGDIQDIDDIGANARFQWEFGLWSGSISYDLVKQNDHANDQTRNRQRMLFEASRKF